MIELENELERLSEFLEEARFLKEDIYNLPNVFTIRTESE